MDIQEFFQQSAGKWFAHRTTQHLVQKQSEAAKSNLFVEILPQTDAAIEALCQQYEIAAHQAAFGVHVSWQPITESLSAPRQRFWGNAAESEPEKEFTLLVPIANPDQPQAGKLLRSVNRAGQTPNPKSSVGRYSLGADDALILIHEAEDWYTEERIWFVSPNLRLRTSLIKRADGLSLASFCSEIRMIVAPPPQE